MGQIKNIKLHIVTDIKLHCPNKNNNNNNNKMASNNAERTFIMIKPDGVARNLTAKIIERFEQRGYKLVAMRFMMAGSDLLNQHYGDLKEKTFLPISCETYRIWSRCPNGMGGKGCCETRTCVFGRDGPIEIQTRINSR